MKLGDMTHKISIQKKGSVPDGIGGEESDWVDHASVWGKAIPLSSREFFQQQKEQAESILEFRFRVCEVPVVKLSMQIVYNSEEYDILSADPVDNMQTWLVRGKVTK
ncbi:phage head closure protein [Maridesulfovibrio ferrireducens]|uniref:phage head closure protein n=1 Tax=Maridesulfovibrio ferrireducens TaxID=246191 RepID=UPI001A2CB34D|nr:phage head closure protein [Maridesulfovibrio ferrireducens]MBI9110288.1 phage head closure protein [Maridesulfovibrio ferrireducens]